MRSNIEHIYIKYITLCINMNKFTSKTALELTTEIIEINVNTNENNLSHEKNNKKREE